MGFRLPKTKGMLRREAAGWLARVQSGRDPDAAAKLQRWRDRDPRHAEAFDSVRRSYERAGLLRNSPAAMVAPPTRSTARPEWRLRPALAAVAAIAIAVMLFRGSLPFAGTDAVMLMTNVGEIKRVALADGSKVTLDTATKVEVTIAGSRRSAQLRRGRARFHIARSAGPFVVQTASATITASEGIVEVEQDAKSDRVQVLAGAADVRRSGAAQGSAVALRPGDSLTVRSEGGDERGHVAAGPDWTRGMLQFNATPLADAAALANRYSERHIILAGELEGLRVTGAFRAGDTAGLAKALAAAFRLSLEQRADGALVLSPQQASRRQEKSGG